MSAKINAKQAIIDGKTFLGIELGSTRIKAVLIDEAYVPIASGGHDWENRFENGIWTYHLADVWSGLQGSFMKLAEDVQTKYGVPLTTVGAMGISAMMHGYLVFNKNGDQLAQFRTWRNTITEQAASKLTEKFGFNIPQRWSIAHLYQAVLNNEEHIKDIAFLTTLAGYVHYKLTGKKVLGVGEASGVFPVSGTDFNRGMVNDFDGLIRGLNLGWKLDDILPSVLSAGADAGSLTPDGVKLLDPSGRLQAGIPMCPPEGDAGTGMVATNSVGERTGNVSAGTSVFAMIVLEKALSKLYTEIDMVTTPEGKPVAMVHCNNCTSDLDAWFAVMREANELMGNKVSKPALYDALYNAALEGEADCGGLLMYNYFSGEHMTGFTEGRPLLVRTPESRFNIRNFSRAILFSTMGTLKLGMDILTEKEHCKLDRLLGHGGLFKTKLVGQKLMAAALNVPVAVMDEAGEGGAWGIALLAAYMKQNDGETLEHFLNERVFADKAGSCVEPDAKDIDGFKAYMQRYSEGLAIEQAAVEHLK